ncbi:MAG: sulfotransferase family protein [Promethearchaeota archaeon]
MKEKKEKKEIPTWLIVTEEIMAAYTITNLFRTMWMARFRIHPKYWLRLGYALVLSTLTTPFAIIQRLKLRKILKDRKIAKDPVFIVGNYRTGTTYMITTFSKDKSKGFVSNIIGYAFSFFLSMPKLTRKIIDASLPEKRPMDNVLMSADEPTEDEYCLGTYSKYAYYHGFVFPQKFKKLARYHSFHDMPKDARKWQKDYSKMVKILDHTYDGRQLILKNPAVCFKIKYILDMYPNAKFIFTFRNPYTLYASNMNYYRKVVPLYNLQTYTDDMLKEEVISHYAEMCYMWEKAKKIIPDGNYIESKYEDFLQTPMEHMEKFYRQFNLSNWEEAKVGFQAHVDSQKTYIVNKFDISDEVIETVNKNWGKIVKSHGYERLESKDPSVIEVYQSSSEYIQKKYKYDK